VGESYLPHVFAFREKGRFSLNLSSVLIKKLLDNKDVETWSLLQQHYLPRDFHRVYEVIQRHVSKEKGFPSFDDLFLSVRDPTVRNSLALIQQSEAVDIETSQLLEYLKGEYAERASLESIDNFLDKSVMLGTAQEIVEELHSIAFTLEDSLDLKHPENDMRRIPLFEPDELLGRRQGLGLNKEYDEYIKFGPEDLVVFGGYRGAGKSLTCANIVSNIYESNNSAIYFSIEMTARQTLQRICSISTGVPLYSLINRNLDIDQWERVAHWWSHRFESGEEPFKKYLMHRKFDELHADLINLPLRGDAQVDVVYEPSLTIAKIKAELDKKMRTLSPQVVVIDYINKVKRAANLGRAGQFDWQEQVEVSNALKQMAQDYKVLFISPYQTDATGEARFAKGILDAVDAAFTLNTHQKKDNVISFKCVKMRNGADEGFISTINWDTLKIGPDTAEEPGVESNEEDPEDL
jgi:archaellum biogenesis ATPase FlaH